MGEKDNIIFGKRITIPEFKMAEYPTIRISEIKRRRFNLIDRALPEKVIYICG